MNYSTCHTHTTFSDGKNSLEEMVKAAIALGMPVIGISDHSDTACDQSYCMKTAQYEDYLAELNRVKEKYADQITVLRGIELDRESDTSIVEQLDYVIGSVHYLLCEDRVYAIDHAKDIQLDCIEREFGGDPLAFVQAYYDLVVDHITRCKPTIAGHFDVITKYSVFNEDDPEYQRIALEALEKVFKVCPVMEVNTCPILRKLRDRPYPAPFLLKRWRELGGEVTFGADSHAVDTIASALPHAVKLMKKAGFDHMVNLGPDGFYKVAL